MNKVIPQGGGISTVVWLIVIDETVRILDWGGLKVIGYDDSLGIVMSRMILSDDDELMLCSTET